MRLLPLDKETLDMLDANNGWALTDTSVVRTMDGGATWYNATPASLTVTPISGTNLLLQWPGDHTGWRVQTQTNPVTVGLSTNWATLAGSSLTNQIMVPVDKTNGSVFFRMVYP